MGLALGFWDAANTLYVEQLTTSAATLNLAFGGSPTSAGAYCVAIRDVGGILESADFTLTVTHY